MKKIILFGGSFDPIHNGHIKAALEAFKKVNADHLYFVMSYISPDKKTHKATWEQRKEMINIAISNCPFFSVSEIEKENEEISYTYKNIEYFKKNFPNSEIFLLVGSDQFNNFYNWKNYDYIEANCKIICYERKNHLVTKKNGIIFIEEPKIDTSSSELILMPNIEMINQEVLNYINQNSIYGIYRLEKEGMSQSRLNHSIEVANISKKIANKYGKNFQNKAYCAGLYHDIAKEVSMQRQIESSNKLLNYTTYPSWKVIHGPLGKYILEKKYLFNDDEILNAVKYHTIPRNNPKLLEKIVFCADKISSREHRKTDHDLIHLCISNIDKGYEIILQRNMESIKK
ncbi:MAG: nicotinate-nucleotide adenylyltransferase [Mycoplasmoidaceae bacterium]